MSRRIIRLSRKVVKVSGADSALLYRISTRVKARALAIKRFPTLLKVLIRRRDRVCNLRIRMRKMRLVDWTFLMTMGRTCRLNSLIKLYRKCMDPTRMVSRTKLTILNLTEMKMRLNLLMTLIMTK